MSPLYTVVIDGVEIQCETAEAALALVRLQGGAPSPKTGSGSTAAHAHGNGSRWTEQRVTDFFKLIDGNQRKLVDKLLETDDTRTDAQLLQMLSLSSGMALAGVFAGLYKNAKKVGADPKE